MYLNSKYIYGTLGLREIEWSRFAGRIVNESLTVDDIQRAASKLGPQCISAPDDDAYVARSRITSDRVFRIVCGDTWWQIDDSDGRIIEKLDTSRRVYRWVFRALHTLDFPALVERPALRSGLIMLLCGGGFCFSLTGVVIGWRRLKRGGLMIDDWMEVFSHAFCNSWCNKGGN